MTANTAEVQAKARRWAVAGVVALSPSRSASAKALSGRSRPGETDLGEGPFPARCARVGCDAVLIDLDGDGAPEILQSGREGTSLFKLQPNGSWSQAGAVLLGECDREVLRRGKAEAIPPVWRDFALDGRRRTITPTAAPECPGDAPAAEGPARVILRMDQPVRLEANGLNPMPVLHCSPPG